jgi:uncharacterized protein
MVFKIILVVIAIFLIYIVFFKKNREKELFAKKNEKIVDEMVECPTCKVYVSKNEAILSNGKLYCSKECLEKK